MDLAIELGVDQSRISKWETGSSVPKGQNREALKRTLRLPRDFFDMPEESRTSGSAGAERSAAKEIAEEVRRALAPEIKAAANRDAFPNDLFDAWQLAPANIKAVVRFLLTGKKEDLLALPDALRKYMAEGLSSVGVSPRKAESED
jgi:transcriptional regulator with XRE-family HTH domain